MICAFAYSGAARCVPSFDDSNRNYFFFDLRYNKHLWERNASNLADLFWALIKVLYWYAKNHRLTASSDKMWPRSSSYVFFLSSFTILDLSVEADCLCVCVEKPLFIANGDYKEMFYYIKEMGASKVVVCEKSVQVFFFCRLASWRKAPRIWVWGAVCTS